MLRLGTVLGQMTPSSTSGEPSASWPTDGDCPKCRRGVGDLEDASHRCCVCQDGGRVALRPGQYQLCPACRGTGTGLPAPAAEEAARLPARYRAVTFDQWLPPDGPPRKRCERWAASWPPKKPLLFLTGEKGTGKTMLACAALRHVQRRHGVRGQFWPVVDLLDRYRRTADEDRALESLDQVDEAMRRLPLLVLDDLGAHRSTEWAEERLFALIDWRYREGQPLIITSNVPPKELAPRVRSRLSDTAVCEVVLFAGPDRRPTAGRAS